MSAKICRISDIPITYWLALIAENHDDRPLLDNGDGYEIIAFRFVQHAGDNATLDPIYASAFIAFLVPFRLLRLIPHHAQESRDNRSAPRWVRSRVLVSPGTPCRGGDSDPVDGQQSLLPFPGYD